MIETLRIINVALAVLALLLMLYRFDVWVSWTVGLRFLALGAGLLVAQSIYSTFEAWGHSEPPNVRAMILTVALAWIVGGISLLRKPKGKDNEYGPDYRTRHPGL